MGPPLSTTNQKNTCGLSLASDHATRIHRCHKDVPSQDPGNSGPEQKLH